MCGGECVKVLILEDDRGVGRFMSALLADAGIIVDWRRNHFLQIAEKPDTFASFDAAIIDLHLSPQISGLDLLRLCAANAPATKRIVLTASFDEAELEQARDVAHVFLRKPVGLEELMHALGVEHGA